MPQLGQKEDMQDDGGGKGVGDKTPGVIVVQTNADGTKTNKSCRKDCFHCGATACWVGNCPQLSPEERAETMAAMRRGTYQDPPKEEQEKNRHAGANTMIVGAGARRQRRARRRRLPPKGSGGAPGDGGKEDVEPGQALP